MPGPHQPEQGQEAEPECEQTHDRLRRHHQPALVEAIGGGTGERQQDELRAELAAHHDADGGGAVAGQLGEHQPVLPDPLHPGADVGEQRARRPQPVVAIAQRPEHATLWRVRRRNHPGVVAIAPSRSFAASVGPAGLEPAT
jgi:hypothetical protein